MEKHEENGKVAVLISPGYGAGWSTWNYEDDISEAMLFDKDIIKLLLENPNATSEAATLAESKWPDCCVLGAKGLVVRWVCKGDQIRIRVYDGAESLETIGDFGGYIA